MSKYGSMPGNPHSYFSTFREIWCEFDIDETRLWQLVEHNHIGAYVYYPSSNPMHYLGKRLNGEKFYPLHREDIIQFKNHCDSKLKTYENIKIWRFKGMEAKLDSPLPVSRDFIRFCVDEVRPCIDLPNYRHPQKKYVYIHDAHSDKIDLRLDQFQANKKQVDCNRDPDRASTSLEKILALLAYRYAEKDNACLTTNNNINVSQLQRLLLKDAEKLGLDDEGISACRKQIGDALKLYNLSTIRETS